MSSDEANALLGRHSDDDDDGDDDDTTTATTTASISNSGSGDSNAVMADIESQVPHHMNSNTSTSTPTPPQTTGTTARYYGATSTTVNPAYSRKQPASSGNGAYNSIANNTTYEGDGTTTSNNSNGNSNGSTGGKHSSFLSNFTLGSKHLPFGGAQEPTRASIRGSILNSNSGLPSYSSPASSALAANSASPNSLLLASGKGNTAFFSSKPQSGSFFSSSGLNGSGSGAGSHSSTSLSAAAALLATDSRTATLSSSIFNLVNTVIGGGLVALPYAFHSSGIILGIILLFITYVLGWYSLHLLVKCSELAVSRTYMGVAKEAFGQPGVVVTQLSVAIATFGTMISYFIILGDMMSPLIGYWGDDYCALVADRRFTISLALILLIPLSIPKSINSLRFTSLFAIVAISYLVVIVVFRSGESLADHDELECEGGSCASLAKLSESIFRAIPIITFAFTCQMNIFPLVSELSRPTKKRVATVIGSSLSICLFVYVIVATFGYLTFYDEIRGNILLNYAVSDTFVMVGRIALAMVIVFSFPLMAQPCIANLDALLFPRSAESLVRHIILVTGVVGVAYTVAMLVEDVSLILGVSGATAATAISFILPSLIYLRLDSRTKAPINHGAHSIFTKDHIPALILLTLGIVFCVVSTVVTLIPEDSAPSTSLCQSSGNSTNPPNPPNATMALVY